MPELRGQALRQALATLAPLRLRVDVTGSGLVIRQVPAAGTALEPGATARLVLASRSRGSQ
ncbi:MAG: hypothetical protein AUH81_04875 [Candidatus Rokubacteria bacterium 13_1_40CM_4_69_5]|nr:MAG: hypothetical protein AUH81_04875 [Candidatus Rokubacteria bacterium 13_1_40CM_4_69_5]